MAEISDNHKRIAKNTVFLYLRMLFLMIITLYTSRVILYSLGVVDYGVHNAVAGFVSMFHMVSNSMSGGISRFITFSLGQGDRERTKRVFSNAFFIQAGLSILIFVVCEIFFVWFVNNKMTIPPERLKAANVVLHISMIIFILNLFRTPYDACIVAHEKMSTYAYLGIFEGLAGLATAMVVRYSTSDRLIVYSSMHLIIAVAVLLMYAFYCRRHFYESHFIWAPDKKLIGEMLGFSGWNFFGVMSGVMRGQGINMLLNVYCGPTVNAARGLAVQVDKAVTKFSTTFMTAVRPQITKNYAMGNRAEYERLTMTSSKLAFLMLMLFNIPIIANTNFILNLWLVKVPAHTCLFCQLILIQTLVNSFSTPLISLLLATGKIRKYQLVVGSCTLLNFPVAWILLYLGFPPESTVCTIIFISFISLMLRVYFLHEMVQFPVIKYLKNVVLLCFVSWGLATIVPLLLNMLVTTDSILILILKVLVIEVSSLSIIYYIGLTSAERNFLVGIVKSKLR